MIISIIAKRYTSLQISLGVLLREEKFIEHFPIPTFIFNEEGNARFPKKQSSSEKHIKVDSSKHVQPQPNAVILDGCALLWSQHCPDQGKVQDVVNLFVMESALSRSGKGTGCC